MDSDDRRNHYKLKRGEKSYVRRELSARHNDWRTGSDRDSLSEDSGEDWRKWKAFLPMKSILFSKKVLLHKTETSLRAAYGTPFDVYHEMIRGADYFEDIEIWGKREIHKDPIAVGIAKNGNRHLICRWGTDKLIPFERIKSRSWLYHLQNFGVNLLASESFWLTGAAATIFGIVYIATW
jgi:hypothetical protein